MNDNLSIIPGCAYCKHLHSWGITCKAFPGGIPPFLTSGQVAHTEPMAGDNGVIFEWSILPLFQEKDRYPAGDPLGRGGRYITGEEDKHPSLLDLPPQTVPPLLTEEYRNYMAAITIEEVENWPLLPQAADMFARDWLYAADIVIDDLYEDNATGFWLDNQEFAKWFISVPNYDAGTILRTADIVQDLFDMAVLTWDDLAVANPLLLTGLLVEDFDYWTSAATWTGTAGDVDGYLFAFEGSLMSMLQPDFPNSDIWAERIEESQQNEFLTWLRLVPPSVSFIKSARDISHVLRDERGRWTNTPNAGDDAPAPEGDFISPRTGLNESALDRYAHNLSQSLYNGEDARYKIANIVKETQPVIDQLKKDKAAFHKESVMTLLEEGDVIRATSLDASYRESAEWNDLQNRINAATDEMVDRAKHIRGLEEKQKQSIWAVLKTGIDTPMDVKTVTFKRIGPAPVLSDIYNDAAEEASQFISADAWTADGRYGDNFPKDGMFIAWEETDKGRAEAKKGHIIAMPARHRNTKRIVSHEMGHLLESNNQHAMDAARRLLVGRTGFGSTKKLADTNPGRGYEVHEKFWPDAFVSDYVGKQYIAEDGEIYATEIISMGLEHYIYDTANFAQNDTEHFDLMWDVLHHKPYLRETAKTGHWENVLRDEQGRWKDTPGAGDDAPEKQRTRFDAWGRPVPGTHTPDKEPASSELAPEWINDGVGRAGDYSDFNDKASTASGKNLFNPEWGEPPDVEKMKAGTWDRINNDSMSIGIWKVADSDGKEWFVKYIGENSQWNTTIEAQTLNERDAGYLGEALGLNVIPAWEITRGELGDFVPPGFFSPHGKTTANLVASPWIDIMPGLEMGSDLRAEWKKKKVPLDTLIKSALFDAVMNNTDRHNGNYGADVDGNMVLFDHGFAFNKHGWRESRLLSEVSLRALADRSYLLWLRQGVEDSASNMTPEHEAFVKRRYNEIRDWWEEDAAGERGFVMVSQLNSPAFLNPDPNKGK